MPVTRRRITLSGIKPAGIKPVQEQRPAYRSYCLYGAVEPQTGERFFLERKSLDSDGFQNFLDGFSDRFSESLNVLVLDNGQFHKAKKLTIPENTRLLFLPLFLPPYSPELNPIERFWQDLKDDLKDHVAFHLHETLSVLKQKVRSKLDTYTDDAVASLTGYEYLLDAASA